MIPLKAFEINRARACRFEPLLASFLTDFASEPRNHDLESLISCVRNGAHMTLDSYISTASELFFREHHLKYGWHSKAQIDWFDRTFVTLALELTCPQMTIFFSLRLESCQAAVLIDHINLGLDSSEMPAPTTFEKWILACRTDAPNQ